jgi:hypothetical protein
MSKLDRCPAEIELSANQLAWLAELPIPAHSLKPELTCDLDQGHDGPHASLGQHSGDTEWWVRWTLHSSEISPFEACPSVRVSGDEDEDSCLLFEGHPGSHLYGDERRM